MKRRLYIAVMLLATLITGCSGFLSNRAGPAGESRDATIIEPDSDKVVIYFYRAANFKGGGRTHLLQLDGRTLGRLTDDNFYRIELWPGKYYLNIHLPEETFMGQTSLPMSIGVPLHLTDRDAGKAYLCLYEEGEKVRRWPAEPDQLRALRRSRTLNRALQVAETAHLKEFFKTRYEGPEMHGQPHGRGTLYWDDGSRYEGVFHYGFVTPEGRFYFPDGDIYMGRLDKGRPVGSGVLMSPDGEVIYAGPFKAEKPHGKGLRAGDDGPEYCTYEMGEDITPSFFDLAEQAVRQQDRQAMEQFLTFCPYSMTLDADEAFVELYDETYQALGDHLDETRPFRKDAAYRDLTRKEAQGIAQERAWCEDQFARDRHWCICAPFDENAAQWRECIW